MTREVLLWPDCAVAAFHWQPNQQFQLTTHMALQTAYKGVSCFSLLRMRVCITIRLKQEKKSKAFSVVKQKRNPSYTWQKLYNLRHKTPKLNWWQETAMNLKAFERNYKLPTQLKLIKGCFFVRYTSLAAHASKEQSRVKHTTGYILPGNTITIS